MEATKSLTYYIHILEPKIALHFTVEHAHVLYLAWKCSLPSKVGKKESDRIRRKALRVQIIRLEQ